MEKKVKVPDSWDEVTVGQFQEFVESKRDYEKVSVLLDEDPEEVRKYDPQSMSRVAEALSWISALPDQNRYREFIEIDGVEYRLVKNLNGFSLGEWVDMDEYFKDEMRNLHLIFSMLYRPIGEYRAEDVQTRAELFQDKAMIGHLYGSLIFFSHVETKSTSCIQRSLILSYLRRMKQKRKEEKDSRKKEKLKSGHGTITPTV